MNTICQKLIFPLKSHTTIARQYYQTYCYWPSNSHATYPAGLQGLLPNNWQLFLLFVRHTNQVCPNRPINRPTDLTYQPKNGYFA